MARMQGRKTLRDSLLDAKRANDMMADLAGKPRMDYGAMIKPAPVKRAIRKPSAVPSEPLEHEIQKNVIQWWGTVHNIYRLPRFALAAIPNGQILMASARHPERVMSYLHAEGFRDGIPDLILAAPSGDFHGLFIELKRRTGVVRPEQKEWIAYLLTMGYHAAICRSAEDAIQTIKSYLK